MHMPSIAKVFQPFCPDFMHDSARLSFFADPTPIMKMCHSRSLTRLPRCPFGVFPLFHRLW